MAASGLFQAEAMSRAVVFDPQFRLPHQPQTVPGLVTLPMPDGLLVEGTPTRQALRGTAARELVPQLLTAFDGRRDVDQVAADLGRPAAQVLKAASLLYTSGLLQDGAGPQLPDDVQPATAAFLSRSIDSSRVNVSGGEAVLRLRAARVAVVGAPAAEDATTSLCSTLVKLLVASEVGRADLVAADDPLPADTTLVVAVGDVSSAAVATAFDDGVPVVPVRLTGTALAYGPRLSAGTTCCLDCVSGQRDTESDTEPVTAAGPVAVPAGLAGRLAAAVLGNDLLALLSRVGRITMHSGLVRVDLAAWQQRVHPLAARPSCPRCGLGYGPPPGSATDLELARPPLALVYETSVAFPPRSMTNPRDHQAHYRPGNLALQEKAKRWPSAAHLTLPEGPPVPGQLPATSLPATSLPARSQPTTSAPEQGGGKLDLPTLAAMLLRAGGWRERPGSTSDLSLGTGKVQRFAPTGGNLGSPQLHVVATDVVGLASGSYGYRPDTHELASLPWADPATPVAGVPDDAAAVVVLTAAFNRVASKYSTFAWRVVHLDAGVAMTQLRLVAAAFGIASRLVDRWDDAALADLLMINLDDEPVTGVVALYP